MVTLKDCIHKLKSEIHIVWHSSPFNITFEVGWDLKAKKSRQRTSLSCFHVESKAVPQNK